MNNYIKQIQLKASHILSQEEVVVFDFKPIIGINIFYCPNGFGKSTLFKLLRTIFGFNKESESINLSHIKIQDHYISNILVVLQIGDRTYDLIYKYQSQSKKMVRFFGEQNIQELSKIIFNQTTKDHDIEKRNFMSKRATIASLNRFNFCSNDRINSTDSEKSNLIDAHKDGKAKGILFDYILGNNFKYIDKNTLESMHYVYTYLKNDYDIEESNKELRKLKDEKIDYGIFSSYQEEKNGEIKNKEASVKESGISLLDLDYALKKLIKIKEDITGNLKYSNFEQIIDNELEFLKTIKDEFQNEYTQKQLDLEYSIQSYSGRIQTNCTDKLKKENEINIKSKENVFLKKIRESYEQQISGCRSQFTDLYKNLLQGLGYQNCQLDIDKLTITVSSIEDNSEATLKVCRLLFFIALQCYKQEHPSARTIGIGFYDGLLDGVGYDKLEKIINILQSKNLQIFLFMPKLTKEGEQESLINFLQENSGVTVFSTTDRKKIFSLEHV